MLTLPYEADTILHLMKGVVDRGSVEERTSRLLKTLQAIMRLGTGPNHSSNRDVV